MSRADGVVEAMIGHLIKDGARSRARRLVTCALVEVSKHNSSLSPEDFLAMAVQNAAPILKTVVHRLEGASYHVPRAIPESERQARAIRIIIRDARRKSGRPTAKALAIAILQYACVSPVDPEPERTKGAVRLPKRGVTGAG